MLLRLLITLTLIFFPAFGAYAREWNFDNIREGDSYWTILGGYGATHVGMGKTREHVETVDVVPRYGRVLVGDIGSSWYSGRHDLLVEVPVSLVVVPDVSPMVGMNFLASWTFTAPKHFSPYFFAGGGPVYTEADIPGMGSNINGNYQFGTGVVFKTGKGHYFNMEYRFHHISNAGMESPNVPLNSSKFLLGMTFF